MHPSWDSLSDLQSHQILLKNGLLVGMVLVAALTACWNFYTGKVEDKISELTKAEAAAAELKKTKLETQRADKAESALAALRKSMANLERKATTRAEMVTPEKRQQLIAQLKRALPQNSVFLIVNRQSGEALECGDVMREILQKSGCLAGFDNTAQTFPPRYGITVMRLEGSSEAPAATLAHALTEAGFPNVAAHAFGSLPEDRKLQIEIGPAQ